jgi:hypothetical protein
VYLTRIADGADEARSRAPGSRRDRSSPASGSWPPCAALVPGDPHRTEGIAWWWANRLEKLAGDRAGQYSVRVNDQWRVCFTWSAGGASDVELVDYH